MIIVVTTSTSVIVSYLWKYSTYFHQMWCITLSWYSYVAVYSGMVGYMRLQPHLAPYGTILSTIWVFPFTVYKSRAKVIEIKCSTLKVCCLSSKNSWKWIFLSSKFPSTNGGMFLQNICAIYYSNSEKILVCLRFLLIQKNVS